MNNKKVFLKAGTVGFILCTALLSMLTGCVGYVEGPRTGIETTVVLEDDYVYYPDFECYYSSSRHQYA